MKKLSLKFRKKKVIIFDLDGTLAESKSSIDREMAGLLTRLLSEKIVAVISGGRLEQFKKQIIGQFRAPASLLKNMFLFPTTSMSFYRYRDRKWNEVYA